ncbi:hypothetical protein [Sphingopyxis sp. JAI128]|uniref:hypothetical protein n=1 Tax=Sphingopyxis sp. JAI128 TaxID=2723066 RepID=UPI0016124515|nr:hypothetical protein [Sphingopyxis sp. JAI128]MBB6427480.1 hypothetical protein [Sphingopyxis sp. JAI128]
MNNRSWGPLAIIALFAASGDAARAQDVIDGSGGPCRLDLSLAGGVDWLGPVGRGYDIFSKAESYESVTVEIRHSGAACRFFLTGFDRSAGGRPSLANGSNELVYDVLPTANGPSLLSPDYFGSQQSRIEGMFPAGSSVQVVALLVAIPAGQIVRSGRYQGQAMLRLFSDIEGNPQLQGEAPLTITTRVPSALVVNSPDFGGGARETNIDLGDLNGAAEREVQFEMRANADVNMSFHSASGGVLSHANGAPGVRYEVLVRGAPVDIASRDMVMLPFRPDGLDYDIPVQFRVPGQGASRAAGQYHDTLTITFNVP